MLAYERHTNGGAPWLDPIPGEHAGEVGAANQRVSPRQRMTLALRDLEGSPDDEIALALGADTATVGALVARARLRLRQELQLPRVGDGCDDRMAELSAYADGTLPHDGRAGLETHLADCPSCRAALFALREAVVRYRALPVPAPPGELRSRMTVALGAVGFPTRRPRALMPDPAPAASGRPLAAAVTMAALVIVGAGVTFVASRSDDGRDEPARAPAPSPSASPSASRTANAALYAGVTVAVNDAATNAARAMTPRRTPPVVGHVRAGTPRPPAGAAAARASRAGAASSAAGRPRSSGAAPARPAPAAPPAPPAPPPSEPSPLAAPAAKPPKLEDIPVQILPPVAPPHTPATAQAPPPPPEPPPPAAPAEPAQTTST